MSFRVKVYAALVWLILLLLLSAVALRQGVTMDTSVMALLPAEEQQPLVQRAVDHQAAGYANRLLLVISASDKSRARAGVHLAAERLTALNAIANLQWQAPDSSDTLDELFPYRFSILSDQTRERLEEASGERQASLALDRLFNPISVPGHSLLEDPFGLYTDLLLALQSKTPIQAEAGLLRLSASTQPAYLIALQLEADPFSLTVQETVKAVLDPLKAELQQQGVNLERSGLLFHAAAGAEQARVEISTIGVGSLLGIVLLITLVFRSMLPLVLVLLPVLVGIQVAVAVTLLVFGQVHMITAAFGAGLVGVAVDYSMHFICESHRLPRERVAGRLFTGLLLGLGSSVLAYIGLALAPFPGLRQMAVFCAAGLVGAWVTVLLWLPLLTPGTYSPLAAARWLEQWRKACPRPGSRPRLAAVVLAVMAGGSVLIIWQGEVRDDVALLQTSPRSLLEEDRAVQTLLGNGSSAVFLLVTGATLENVLQTEERLHPRLQHLVDEGRLLGYTALSQLLPSRQRQIENQQLVKTLYDAQWSSMAALLKLDARQREKGLDTLEQNRSHVLVPALWQQLALSGTWSHHLVSNEKDDAATVILLQGALSTTLEQELSELAEQEPGVFLVDRIKQINELMAAYRAQISQWLLIAYGVVILMLGIRYRQRCWRILLPPLLASLLTLASFIWFHGGYNLFNLIALMLVLGIGLDMGVFLQESGHSGHTWLAVTLSALSSLLAFGLLALSSTPVLYDFGIIVLPGLLLTWLLALFMGDLSEGDVVNG